MPIPVNFPIQPVTGKICIEEIRKSQTNKSHWMAWWYCGLKKNIRESTQPKVLVAFRWFIHDQLSDNVKFVEIPLTSLGQVRIGSVWQDGFCRSKPVFQKRTFYVNFSRNNWTFKSFKSTPAPFPKNIHLPPYKNDKNWLIEFTLDNGGKLLVPCLEFFYRCYGFSPEIKRILATYPWDEVAKRFNLHSEKPEELTDHDKHWISIPRNLLNEDIYYLINVKYNRFTQEASKSVYSQIETLYQSNNKSPLFIRIGPWFESDATIKVSGIPFDDDKSFLALHINGCSVPSVGEIVRDRQNTNKTGPVDSNTKFETAWKGAQGRILTDIPETIHLTGDQDPDHSTPSIEIEEPEFKLLGDLPNVIDVRRKRTESTKGAPSNNDDPTVFSGGEKYGENKNIGSVAPKIPTQLESKGILRDVWNAAKYLQKVYPHLIKSVAWFSFESGFRTDDNPKLISLVPFDKHDLRKIDGATKNWVFLHPETQIPRGILLIQLIIRNSEPVYIFEIQRRILSSSNKTSEEAFQGLVFQLDNQKEFIAYLKNLCSLVRHKKGVAKKLVARCPGKAAAFNHTTSSKDNVPCEAAVRNALRKIGIFLG